MGSIPIARFFLGELEKRTLPCNIAAVAQLVERVLGKDEVMGSSPISSFTERIRFIFVQEAKLLLEFILQNWWRPLCRRTCWNSETN